jgi:G:T/U-mismatch repair DNA glycosylase
MVPLDTQCACSLDSQIRNRSDNNLLAILAELPALTTIAFNGGTAALWALAAHAARYRIIELPSSSPAYTLRYAEKLRLWQALRGY